MINRENWKLVNKYLMYREQVLQNDPKTIRSGWGALRHVLEWADSTEFPHVMKLRPTLPDYILTARADGKKEQLSPARMEKILTFSRDLFEWLRIEYPSSYRTITASWIESLRVRRSHNSQSRLVRRQFWTLQDVETVLDYPTTSLKHRRDKAAIAFIFLSAMRGAAFVTMPIKAVDLQKRKVYQLPEWGVATKNSKAAITFLLPIPKLLEVVEDWDTYIRNAAESDRTMWYARITPDGENVKADSDNSTPAGRRTAMYEGLKELCKLTGIEWKSPHKIRHGHGVYGVKHARTMAEYKALSQNMMHDTVETTDKTYSVLVNDDVGDIISTFTP